MPYYSAIAQNVYLPPGWSQWQQYLPMINPASNSAKEDMEFMIGNQRFLGLWRNNQGYFANASIRIHKKEQKTFFHVLGAQLVTDKEGEYLQRAKVYAQYAYHLQLGKKIWFAAGMAMGAMSYTVGSSDFNTGGASTAPDGSVGVWMYGDTYHLGFSCHQLFQSTLQPIRETISLVRYFNLVAEKKFDLGPSVALQPSAMMRLAPGYTTYLSIGLQAFISQWLLAGINVGINREIAFIFGLSDIEWGSSRLKGTFAYRIPEGAYSVSNQQSFEIMLGIGFTKKKKKEPDNQEAE